MFSDCPFCHHERATLSASDQLTRAGEKREIYRCDECGCYYPRPRMDEVESLAWLSDLEAHATAERGGTELADPTAPLPAESVAYRLKRMLRPIGFPHDFRPYLRNRIPMRGKSLDIGTYDGRFCAIMRSMGFDAHGLEPQDSVARHARERGLDVHTGAFPDGMPAALESMPFDLISMREVICYFVDLRKALEKANAMLSPGGHCLIKCHQGNSRYYAVTGDPFFKRFGDNVQAIPTLESMVYWLESTGFDVIDVTGGVWPYTAPETARHRRWRKCFTAIRNEFYGLSLFGFPLFNLNQADGLVLLARKGGDG